MGIFWSVWLSRGPDLVDSSVLELHERDRRRGLRERMFGCAVFCWRRVRVSSGFGDFMWGVFSFGCFCEFGSLASSDGVDSPEVEPCVGV